MEEHQADEAQQQIGIWPSTDAMPGEPSGSRKSSNASRTTTLRAAAPAASAPVSRRASPRRTAGRRAHPDRHAIDDRRDQCHPEDLRCVRVAGRSVDIGEIVHGPGRAAFQSGRSQTANPRYSRPPSPGNPRARRDGIEPGGSKSKRTAKRCGSDIQLPLRRRLHQPARLGFLVHRHRCRPENTSSLAGHTRPGNTSRTTSAVSPTSCCRAGSRGSSAMIQPPLMSIMLQDRLARPWRSRRGRG